MSGESSDQPLVTRSIPIHDLGDAGLELASPFQVEVEIYSEEIVARIPELDLWASSTTESEALLLIKREVCILWEELSLEEDARLGKLPLGRKRILCRKIKVHVPA